MNNISATKHCEVLLRHPDYLLELEKSTDSRGAACHQFTLYPLAIATAKPGRLPGIPLFSGQGHEVSRRDIHHAFYLLQTYQMQIGQRQAAAIK